MSGREGILKFDLEENQHEFNIAVNAMNFVGALWGLDEGLRVKIKYFDPDNNSDGIDPNTLQIARDMLHYMMEENGVTFDDYI